VFDLIGRYIPLIEHVKLTSRKGLVISSVLRFLLVPAFYYTTKYGSQGWMIVLTSFLGLTNGYLTVCVLTEAPKGFKVSSVFLNKAHSHILFSFQCNSLSMLYIFVSRGQNRTLWATFLRFSYWRACFVGQFLAGCGL
jgi:hypothetical protein